MVSLQSTGSLSLSFRNGSLWVWQLEQLTISPHAIEWMIFIFIIYVFRRSCLQRGIRIEIPWQFLLCKFPYLYLGVSRSIVFGHGEEGVLCHIRNFAKEHVLIRCGFVWAESWLCLICWSRCFSFDGGTTTTFFEPGNLNKGKGAPPWLLDLVIYRRVVLILWGDETAYTPQVVPVG